MSTPSVPNTALSSLRAQLIKQMMNTPHSKNDLALKKETIVALCGEIVSALRYPLDDSQNDTAYDMFSMLCHHDTFSRWDLWKHDQDIMGAALALYTALPPTLIEARHVTDLVQYFLHASQSNTARCRLICNLLEGPKEHWPPHEIERMYYVFMEMEEEMRHNGHQDQPIVSVMAFLQGLEELSKSAGTNRKMAKDVLYQTVQGLLYDDGLKLYSDILPKLDGYTVVKKSIASRHASVLENLNALVSDEQLEQWFPKSGQRVRRLAQSYPRLQALIEKRSLHQNLSDLSTSVPLRRHKI